MGKRKDNLQSMLGQYAERVLGPMKGHFQVLSTHLSQDLARQLAVAMVNAKLKLDASELGRPLRADCMPDPTVMRQAVDAVLWPVERVSADAELPYDCTNLISVGAAAAVRNLLKQQCGTRGRRRLPVGPVREQGGRHV